MENLVVVLFSENQKVKSRNCNTEEHGKTPGRKKPQRGPPHSVYSCTVASTPADYERSELSLEL